MGKGHGRRSYGCEDRGNSDAREGKLPSYRWTLQPPILRADVVEQPHMDNCPERETRILRGRCSSNLRVIFLISNMPWCRNEVWDIVACAQSTAPETHYPCKFTTISLTDKFIEIRSSNRWVDAKKDVTPLLTHWSYVFLALTQRNELQYFD